VEREDTPALVRRVEHIKVAGDRLDLWWLYQESVEILDLCSRGAVVHGDAHPGNILYSSTGTAILIDFECVGLGPACLDLCNLWIFTVASRFVALGDEQDTVDLFRALLLGTPFDELARLHKEVLRLSVNYEVIYLASEALRLSFEVTRERGGKEDEVYGVVAVLLCRELFNPDLQQLVIRCALAATRVLLHPA